MNRIWPGVPSNKAVAFGGHSEGVVYELFQQIKANADYVVDVHGGNPGFVGSGVTPWTVYDHLEENQELTRKQRAMAFAAGMNVVWERNAGWIKAQMGAELDRTPCRTQTAKLGIPAITLEDEYPMERTSRAIMNLMKHLKMLPGTPEVEQPIFVSKGNWLRAPCGGMAHSPVNLLDKVKKDQVVHTVIDFFGNLPLRSNPQPMVS